MIPTKRRLTFDILYQEPSYCGKTDDDYLTFRASNGVDIISRSRMDIQTDRLWLLGCGPDERSGSMVFSSDAKRDAMERRFHDALFEWAEKASEFDYIEEKQIIHHISPLDPYSYMIYRTHEKYD